jgi:hypothetical protein
MTSKNIKVKSLLAKWLLISTLFVGLFAFTAPGGPSSLQQQKAQIELVFSNRVKSGYRTAYYKLRVVRSQSAFNRTCIQYSNTISAYGRLSKVKFDQLSQQPVFVSTCCLFRQVKTIPQSSGEDISAFLIG